MLRFITKFLRLQKSLLKSIGVMIRIRERDFCTYTVHVAPILAMYQLEWPEDKSLCRLSTEFTPTIRPQPVQRQSQQHLARLLGSWPITYLVWHRKYRITGLRLQFNKYTDGKRNTAPSFITQHWIHICCNDVHGPYKITIHIYTICIQNLYT